MPELSIAIVSWNTVGLLRRCLESIRETIGAIDYELIVVDNASPDGSAGMIELHHPEAKIIRNKENVGFARAMNQGLALATADHVLMLNSDTEILPNALTLMLDFLKQTPNVGCIGPRIIYPSGEVQKSMGFFPTVATDVFEYFYLDRLFKNSKMFSRFFSADTESRRTRDVDWVSGACLMMHRTVAAEIGWLDERFAMYTEEIDLCYRLKQNGFNNYYLPGAEIIHLEGKSSGHRPVWATTALYKSKYLFKQKHFSTTKLLGAKLAAVIGILFRLAIWSVAYAIPGPRRNTANTKLSAHKQLLLWHLTFGKEM